MGQSLSHTCKNKDILNNISGVIMIIRHNIITILKYYEIVKNSLEIEVSIKSRY